MYTKEVLKRFKNPKFVGEIKDADAIGEVGNPRCGDVMKIFLKIEKDTIKDIRFLTYGCPAAISSSEALCELAKNKTLKDALKITHKDIVKKLGDLPSIKQHCSVLGAEALQKAIKNYENK